MTKELFELTGLTKDELANRVVARMTRELLYGCGGDETYGGAAETRFAGQLQKQIRRSIDRGVRVIAERHVHPQIEQLLEGLVLQGHNQWGEKRGEPVTFIEYVVAHGRAYFGEEVNFEGQSREQYRKRRGDTYSWKADTTRAVYLVEKHLQYSVSVAMKEVLKDAGGLLAGGIKGGIETALAELTQKLKVEIKTGR